MEKKVITLKVSAASDVVTMSACAYQSSCPTVLNKSNT